MGPLSFAGFPVSLPVTKDHEAPTVGPGDERRQQEVERHHHSDGHEQLDRQLVPAWALRIERELDEAGVAEGADQRDEPHPQRVALTRSAERGVPILVERCFGIGGPVAIRVVCGTHPAWTRPQTRSLAWQSSGEALLELRPHVLKQLDELLLVRIVREGFIGE